MKKDIIMPEVTSVNVAIAKNEDDNWDVYLINNYEHPLKNILITSKGFGIINNKEKETSVLRHFFDEIPANAAIKIEPIQEELFQLHNEYWVSFYKQDQAFDKKFLFESNVVCSENLSEIEMLSLSGVIR